MTEEEIKVRIAELVCKRFMDMRQSTPRHMIVAGFERPDVLDETESRNLVSAFEQRDGYLPTVGAFALLGDEHELYQFARTALERTAYALWNLYRCEGIGVDHEASEFKTYADQFYSDPTPEKLIPLGLYLAREFGILQTMKMSEDHTEIKSFRVAEFAVRMREPGPLWIERVKACREASRRFQVPVDVLQAVAYEPFEDPDSQAAAFTEQGFWSLIHPEITVEARPRFEGAHYADAVESALKIVAQKVRNRTGITIDGAELMHTAFSPSKPLLIFRDAIPATQKSMQQGYMEMFAGVMMGVRNPKAHGIVKLDQRRAIHFLFVASLLADKVDEAENAP
jgi:uncharacterized protein (TIGR02391 family)